MSDTDTKTHHPFGPSRWPGLVACSGYTPRKGGETEFAERGAAVHDALDTGDFSKLRDDDRETAEWMAYEIAQITQGLDNVESEVGTVIPETGNIPEELRGITGTCDRRWTTEDGSVHIADFKTFSKIGAKNHIPQCVGYALGGPVPKNGIFVFHILHGASRQVETVEMSVEEVCDIAREIAISIGENLAGAKYHKRSEHCDNCAQAGDCPESARVVAFGVLAAGRLTPEVVRANPAEAARLCDWLDAAAKRIEEAREVIATVAKEGTPIEDAATGIAYEVKPRAGRAVVPPLSEIIDRLFKEDGLEERAVLERATIGLTALRELVGKARAEEYAVRGEDILCFTRKPGKKALKA